MTEKKLKPPVTPPSIIKHLLRLAWLQSRERRECLRLAGYTCQTCGKKHSRAKGREVTVECHHQDGIDWDELVRIVKERLFQTPDRLQALCVECHKKEEAAQRLRKDLESMSMTIEEAVAAIAPGRKKSQMLNQRIRHACREVGETSENEIDRVIREVRSLFSKTAFISEAVVGGFEELLTGEDRVDLANALLILPHVLRLATASNSLPRSIARGIKQEIAASVASKVKDQVERRVEHSFLYGESLEGLMPGGIIDPPEYATRGRFGAETGPQHVSEKDPTTDSGDSPECA